MKRNAEGQALHKMRKGQIEVPMPLLHHLDGKGWNPVAKNHVKRRVRRNGKKKKSKNVNEREYAQYHGVSFLASHPTALTFC